MQRAKQGSKGRSRKKKRERIRTQILELKQHTEKERKVDSEETGQHGGDRLPSEGVGSGGRTVPQRKG